MPAFLAFILIFLPPSERLIDEASLSHQADGPRIAIIIDDLGYRLREGQQSIALEAPLTVAIIPGSPHAERLAQAAEKTGTKEILVHLPMAPSRKISWESGLTTAMEKDEFESHARKLLTSIPQAIGVNNHGGSLLTQDRERMSWLMSILLEKNLFFIDSRTTAKSVAGEIAAQALVPHSSRDVFLDNQREVEAIETQLDKLLAHATQHGEAVAIGHPYPETLAVLEARLPEIQKQGFTLVGISQLLNAMQVKQPQNRVRGAQNISALTINSP